MKHRFSVVVLTTLLCLSKLPNLTRAQGVNCPDDAAEPNKIESKCSKDSDCENGFSCTELGDGQFCNCGRWGGYMGTKCEIYRDGSVTFQGGKVELSWAVDGDSVYWKQCTRTDGWAGFSWSTSNPVEADKTGAPLSDIMACSINDDGQLYCGDYVNPSAQQAPCADKEYSLEKEAGWEDGDYICFTLRRNSVASDPEDLDINLDGDPPRKNAMSIAFAYGNSDLDSHRGMDNHGPVNRDRVRINLVQGFIGESSLGDELGTVPDDASQFSLLSALVLCALAVVFVF